MTSPAPAPRVDWRAHGLTFAGLVAAAAYGWYFARSPVGVAMIWPLGAISLTAMALRGRQMLPTLALGAVTGALIIGLPAPIALLMVVPALCEAGVAGWLVHRTRLDLQFQSIGSTLHLAAVVVAMATVSTLALWAMAWLAGQAPPFLEGNVSPWLAHAIGTLTFAPPLLAWLQPTDLPSRPRGAEFIVLLLAVVAMCALVLVTWTLGGTLRIEPMLLALVPLMSWIGLRTDLRVASLLVIVLSAAATLGARMHTGALSSDSTVREVLNVQSFHLLTVLMVLVGTASTTQRERALRRARAAEQRLALVFDGAYLAHALFAIGPDGARHIVLGNRLWQEWVRDAYRVDLTAHRGNELEVLSDAIGRHDPAAVQHATAMETVARSGQATRYEHEVPSARGTRILETTLTPLEAHQGVAHILVTSRDITAERTSQRQLRESELRFAAVSDATADVQLLFAVAPGAPYRLVHLNRAAIREYRRLWPDRISDELVGLDAETLTARLPGFHEAMVQRNYAFMQEAIAQRGIVRYEDRVQTPTGERIAEVTLTPIIAADGVVTHLLRSSTDIAARKAAEESARRFNEALERSVAERTQQLAGANRELVAFGYSLSHDLRAPLRSVEGFSRAIMEDLEQGEPAEIGRHAARIHAAALRMTRLVDDLLRLSQLPTGDLARTDIDLTAMTEEIVRELRQGDDRPVEVCITPGMRVRADARLLAIAMQNLLANAWKYTARRPDARIEVRQELRDGALVTQVRDNGVGFDPRFAQRLFAPFERLHRQEDFEGVGIGLATVQRIVVAHGGRVWADSAVDQGATFSFTLGSASAADGA